MPLPYEVLYLNGPERAKAGVPEMALSLYLKFRGVNLRHASIDWHSGRSFQEILDSTTEQAKQKISKRGRLAIVGASVGGGLGVSVFQRLRADNQELDLFSVSCSAWLNIGDAERLKHTALRRAGKQPSQALLDSVLQCNETAIPLLTDADKAQMLTTRPSSDEVVPLDVMGIKGVSALSVPSIGHVLGIATAAIRLPHILEDLENRFVAV